MAKKLKKSTTLAQLVSSHKRLLKALRHQTEEIGQLRRYILSMKASVEQERQIIPKDYPKYVYPNGMAGLAVPNVTPGAPSGIKPGDDLSIWGGRKSYTDGHGNNLDHLLDQKP